MEKNQALEHAQESARELAALRESESSKMAPANDTRKGKIVIEINNN